MLIKVKSSREPLLDENGLIIIQQHNENEKWLSHFFEQINYKAYQMTIEWSNFNTEIEEKIMKIDNFKDALLNLGINNELND